MHKGVIYIITLTLFSLSVSAQLPELNIRSFSITDNQTGIQQARNFYKSGDYKTAEAFLFAELERGTLEGDDFLIFSNSLNYSNKRSLSQEFYREYLEQVSENSPRIPFESLYSDPKELELVHIDSTIELTNLTYSENQFYGSNSGTPNRFWLDCDKQFTIGSHVLKGISSSDFGSTVFFNDGTRAVASLWDDKTQLYSLYYFYQKKGNWKEPRKLFSGEIGNYAFPYFDETNNTLYFSSDIKSGYGGYDIYVSTFSGSGFSTPVNIGSKINSPQNDINPYLFEGWLYFSSNGHLSKGGYDIFKYKSVNEYSEIFANCSELNSKDNEFSVIPLKSKRFIVSRELQGSMRLLHYKPLRKIYNFSGIVYNQLGKAVADVHVLIDNSDAFVSTNDTGFFSYSTYENYSTVTGLLVSEGYHNQVFETTMDENRELIIKKVKPIEVIKEVVVIKEDVAADRVIAAPDTSLAQDSIIPEPTGIYYIVVASCYDSTQANNIWNEWLPAFQESEILEYESGLFRIAFVAGTTEEEALESFRKARKIKNDVWTLRPTDD